MQKSASKHYFSLAFKQSIFTATGIALATLLASLLHLQEPFWAALTVFIIMGPGTHNNFLRGLDRLLGTITGALLGLVLSAYIANANLALFLLTVFCICMSSIPFMHTTQHPYAVILGLVTCLLVMASVLSNPHNALLITVWRCTEVSLGVIVVWFMSLLYINDMPPIIFKNQAHSINYAHVIKISFAITLTFLLWILSGWPGGLQGIITVLVLSLKVEIEAIKFHAAQRLLGCLIGAAIGILSLHFLIYNIYDLMIIIIIFGTGIMYLYLKYQFRYSYAFIQAILAFLISVLTISSAPITISAPLERISGIILGILSFLLINYAFDTLHRSSLAK